MFVRLVQSGLMAVVALAFAAGPAEAFGRRSAPSHSCTPVYCYPHFCCWCPCPPAPCPAVHCCQVFQVVGTPVPIGGPIPTILLGGKVGHGVIVQVDIPSGTSPAPTDLIQVTQSGTGEVKYEGWNKKEVTPGTPGGLIRYSIFLCPTKAGEVTVNVGFAYSDNTMKSVPFAFKIVP